MIFDFSSSSSSSALSPAQKQDCNFLVARKRNLFSFSSAGSSNTSESEVEYNVEAIGIARTELAYKLSNIPAPPIPAAASTLERVIISFTALYASIKLISLMAANEVGRTEGLDLMLLSIWTWLMYSFGFPFSNNEEKLFHRLWGTDESLYRTDVDDGAFYGTLLTPIVAAAKIIDIRRSSQSSSTPEHNDDSSIDVIHVNFELCFIMGCGLILHMFMSKHIKTNLGTIWTIIIITILSIILAAFIAAMGFLPFIQRLPSDYIIFSQLFYQISLYSIARLMKRSFTFGELAVVSQILTLLAVEAWILTVNKFELLKLIPLEIHIPSSIIIFQIALVLGIPLIGIILSPFLIHSRHLAQQRTWKSKRSHIRNNNNGKKRMALVIYLITAVMVGLIGLWVQNFLGRNPYLWVFAFVIESRVRIFLCIFWIGLIAISLVLFNQMGQTRKTYSLNSKRKYFHFLALVMFIPGYLYEPEFMHLAFSVAFAALIYLEYLRYFAVYPIGKQLHMFLSEFLDSRDSGPCILSHIYLLIGCAGCIWLDGTFILANLSGIFTLGLGDSMASIIGKRYGRNRWPKSCKTIEGSIAFFVFLFFGAFILVNISSSPNMWPGSSTQWFNYALAVLITALLEAVSYQNDNLILPLFMWSFVNIQM
ncbi:hypothetical protein RclHR1_01860015 [Rhizophagus clarus]|uniref:dolichol kinase n=1 Tax=Rhizophagus clarus TaxID=94130 RepID=A0A2Z6R347_9GLOM|nr:hypothetical protein RclHR1_01860015 [Rhizophagus clarus]GES79492.1 dolichol kinase [Rhizophagus clarus]